MSQTPGFELPPDLPPVKRSNSHVIWVVVIVALAGFCIVALLVGAAVLFPVFSQARSAAQTTACLSNVKQMAISQLMYSTDWDDRLPAAKEWQPATLPYIKKETVFHCPTLKLENPAAFGYAFNRVLEKREISKIAVPDLMVMLFETGETGENVSGGSDLQAQPGRHRRSGGVGSVFGFLDGHAKLILDRDPPGNWEPGTQR